MNISKTYLVIAIVALLAIGFGLGVLGNHQSSSLGATAYDVLHQVGDIHQGMGDTLEFTGGNFVGPIVTSLTATFNGLFVDTATAIVNDLIQAVEGFSQTISTSTAITAAQFCSSTHILVSGSNAVVTTTLPAATTTYTLCGSTSQFGAYSTELITNNSTNTVNWVAGTGVTFRCSDAGVGTTTNVGACTASQYSETTSSDSWATGYWTASGTQIIDISTQFH